MNTVTEVTAQSEQDTPQAVVVDIALPQEPVIERSPENDGIYRAIRAEIHAELSLITARVNWLIASQALMTSSSFRMRSTAPLMSLRA